MYFSFPEAEHFNPFLKGQQCLPTDHKFMIDNLENIVHSIPLIFTVGISGLPNDFNLVFQLETVLLAFPYAKVQSFSTFVMIIRKKDIVFDKLNKSNYQRKNMIIKNVQNNL